MLPLLASWAKETNRFNLSEKPTAPRFPVTDKTWPKSVGESEVCLWHDDKLAALSLGVDDNQPGDIDWWKDQAALYDFKVTWFIITGRLDYSRSTGSWKQYRELSDLGHGVESHSVSHMHVTDPGWGTPAWSYAEAAAAKAANAKAEGMPEDGAPAVPVKPSAEPGRPPAKPEQPAARPSAESLAAARLAAADKPAIAPPKGVEWEYAHSVEQIEGNIPGKRVGALAYPGGKNTVYNDRNIAAKYFRVARGATGAPNKANQTDYMSTNAMSNWSFDSANSGNVCTILDQSLYKGFYYRGWAVLFTHNIIETMKPRMKRTFEFIKENCENLWVGLYTDVAKYGQERDTAELKVGPLDPEKLTFVLTDEMDDSYFNIPLTVKMRIPNEWKEVSAVQAGKPVSAKVLEHEGALFALVQAVPDAGPVTVVKKS